MSENENTDVNIVGGKQQSGKADTKILSKAGVRTPMETKIHSKYKEDEDAPQDTDDGREAS